MSDQGTRALVPARIIVIVAHDRPDLYAYLVEGFTGLNDVEVIVDRRIPEPEINAEINVPSGPSVLEFPRRPDVYDELNSRGFVIKRLGQHRHDRLVQIHAWRTNAWRPDIKTTEGSLSK